jgi:hypothetical protein
MKLFLPGTRVKVFDPSLYKDDEKTPPTKTFQSATVVAWYGAVGDHGRRYSSLVGVVFDHRPETVSKAHFTAWLEFIS